MTTPASSRVGAVGRRAGSSGSVELIAAAERLFAARGIDGVSLREITREANQRNTTALQYHFGDRDGLVRAIIHKHAENVAVRRSALLEVAGPADDLTLRDGATVLVQPLIAKLTSGEGGSEFLQIAAELLHRTDHRLKKGDPAWPILRDHLQTLDRWAEAFEHLIPEGAAGPPLHRRFAVIRFAHIEVGRRARVGRPIDVPLFASQLIDMTTALLGADLSPETQRLLAARKSRSRG